MTQAIIGGTTAYGDYSDRDICPICGELIYPGSGRCTDCNGRANSPQMRAQVSRFLAYARREKARRWIHDWWEATEVR
jgi:hypothetical protein